MLQIYSSRGVLYGEISMHDAIWFSVLHKGVYMACYYVTYTQTYMYLYEKYQINTFIDWKLQNIPVKFRHGQNGW